MSTPITSGSPKLGCSSPGRRHNPYAATHVDGTPVSLGTPLQPSLSTSFATQPTTPQLHSAGASWTPAAAMSAVPFVPAHPPMPVGEFPLQGGPQVQSFYSDVSSPNTYHAAVPPAVYDAVDPNIAFMMYNAASAAANAAANGFVPSYMPEQYEVPLAVRHAPMPVQQRRPTQAPAMTAEPAAVPTLEDMQALQGTLVEEARTASGSSFIQSAVKETQDFRLVTYVWSQLAASLGDLLLDAHGCYVIKTLLERLPPQQIAFVLDNIQNDEQLGFSICTHSLHTRRVVQHIIENIDGGFLCALMSRHCVDVAMTQQGCIVMQRAMDHAPPGPARDRLFEAIATNLVAFAKDPYANYVVQHLMEVGERSETANNMWKAIQGRVVELACNKFASNVIEKCLFHCTAEIQHEILLEMYSVGPQMLYNMLQDSFGNYIIQSSIALATFRDVSLIDERLRPVLAHTPYGHKIEGRLDRRLKGKAVTARTPVPAAAAAAPQQQQQQQQPRRQNGRGSKAPVPAGEVPW